MACTSHARIIGDPFIQTNKRSAKTFALTDGHPNPATNISNLHHDVREPSRTVNIVPDIKAQSLLSGGKFSKAGYISVCNKDEVNIYGRHTAKIVVSEEDVLRG